MNQTYTDDHFTYERVAGGGIGYDGTLILVRSEKYPELTIRVWANPTEEKLYIGDNYLGLKFEQETRAYIRQQLSSVFGNNVYVGYAPDSWAYVENGSSATTFEEYRLNPDAHIGFTSMVVSDIQPVRVKQYLCEIFADMSIDGYIYFITEDIQLTNDVGKENVQHIFRYKDYDVKLFFIKDNQNNFSTFKWEENND